MRKEGKEERGRRGRRKEEGGRGKEEGGEGWGVLEVYDADEEGDADFEEHRVHECESQKRP